MSEKEEKPKKENDRIFVKLTKQDNMTTLKTIEIETGRKEDTTKDLITKAREYLNEK